MQAAAAGQQRRIESRVLRCLLRQIFGDGMATRGSISVGRES